MAEHALLGLNILAIVLGAFLFVFRLGGKMDRLSGAIEHLTKVLEDHEDRIRILEHDASRP